MSYEQFFREAQKSKQGVPSAPKVADKGAQASAKTFAGELRGGLSPEELVKAHFVNAKAKTQADRRARRKRSKPPVFASLLLLIAIASGVTGYLRPDLAERIPTIELGLFGEADASEKVDTKTKADTPAKETAAKDATAAKEEKKSAESAESSQPTAEAEKTPDVKQWTAEEISFFKKLGERKESLDRREAELVKLEEELQKQKKGLDERIRQLESMRKEISTTLKDRVVLDQEKVAKLVDVYSNMKPTQAARVIETLNEDLAVTILDRLKKKNAAEILNAMSASKAKKLSEMLTGYETVANADASKK
ncbi:MAG: hypothetical protein JNJ49_03290 [Bdellovibrionaceae bacterium]|nr:hypothetical protein [Pseudobdellovibrionaceae bacterium]